MILEVKFDAEIISLMPDVERALATGFESDLQAAIPHLRDAAADWLATNVESDGQSVGYLWERAVVVWSDSSGVHVGIDPQQLRAANPELWADQPGVYAQGVRRLSSIPHASRVRRESASIREDRVQHILRLRSQLATAPLKYKFALWLAHPVDKLLSALSTELQARLLEIFGN